MQNCVQRLTSFIVLALAWGLIYVSQTVIAAAVDPMIIASGWQLQEIAKVTQTGGEISSLKFRPDSWYAATVPGTVLTSLVNDGIYPEPLYGQNNRPDKIPDSLCRSQYWYRTVFVVPKAYPAKDTG